MEMAIEKVTQVTSRQIDSSIEQLHRVVAGFLKGTTPRFFAAHGAAFGHQASTVQVLKRFIALGAVQEAELVYATDEILDKLRIILPQIKPGDDPPPIEVTSEGRTARVTLVKLPDDRLPTPARFAISGGWDYHDVPTTARQLNVELVMAVQPYGWEDERSRYESFAYFVRADRFVVIGDELKQQGLLFRSMLYSRPRPHISNDEWKLLSGLPGKEEIVAASKAVIEGVREERLFCPVYGISDFGPLVPASGPPPASIIFNLAGTIRVLQQRGARFGKGAVILVLTTFKPATWDLLISRFSGAAIPMAAPTVGPFVEKYLCPGGQAKVIVRHRMRDATEISKAIRELRNDEILILNLQGLPQDVFDLMYAEATLPSLLEGAGTAGLAIPLGNPYFRFANVQYPVLPLGGQPTKESTDAADATACLRTLVSAWGMDEADIPPIRLSKYLTEAYSPQSGLYQYFRQFGPFLQDNPQQEKLTAALQWVFTSELFKQLLQDRTAPVGVQGPAGGQEPAGVQDPVLDQVYRDLEANLRPDGTLDLAPGAFSTGPLAELYRNMSDGRRLVLSAAEVKPPEDGRLEARGHARGLLGLATADVTLVFTNGGTGLTGAIRVVPGAAGSWSLTGAPWFLIKDSFLQVVQPADPAAVTTGSVGGAIPLPGAVKDGPPAMNITLSVPPVAGRWVFDASFTEPGPSLSRLFALLGGVNLAGALPAPLNVAADLAVRRFEVRYGVASRAVEAFSVRFGTTEPWPLFGLVVLTHLEIQANVADPGAPDVRSTRFEIVGTFALGPGAVRVSAALPDQIFEGTLVPPEDPEARVRIGDVLALFLPAGHSAPVDGAVTLFDLQYNRRAGAWSVDCGIEADWPVPPAPAAPWFTIKNLSLAVRGDASGTDGRFGGTVLVLPDGAEIELAVEASYRKAAGWRFEGRQTGGAVPLDELLAAYTGWTTGSRYGISDLELVIETGNGSWEFGGRTAEPWTVPFLPGLSAAAKLRLGYRTGKPAPAGPGESAPGESAPGESAPGAEPALADRPAVAAGYFARLETDWTWQGVRLRVWMDYDPEVSAFGITWNGLEGKVTGPTTDGDYTAALGLAAGATLGSVIEAMVSWATGTRFALPAPWSALNSIKPGELALTYRFNPKNPARDQIGFKIGIGPIDMGFARIDGIDVAYRSTDPGRGVMVTLSGFFPWNIGAGAVGDTGTLGPWDASDPGAAPAPPGQGGKYIDLRLLALGQHIDVPGLAQDDTVAKAIKRLAELPVPVSGDIPDVKLDRAVSWTAGLDLGILRVDTAEPGPDRRPATAGEAAKPVAYLLNGQVVFCDPRLYGLRVALDGPAAKVFAGLALEVMYRQISDAVGVYQAEIALPDRMRHLSIGAYSLTLPVFAVAVYTNGDFLVDVGFPRNMDFSRSFRLEALVYPGIPMMGSGGVYLGKLSSATTDLVPRAGNGTFNPVIVFGFGLQVGFGKSVEYGVLRAGFDLTVAGVLEGVIAKWNPYEPESGALERAGAAAADQVQGSYYFLVRGTAGLLGRLYGSVDFSIVKADVDVRISVLAEIAYESFVSLSLSVVMSVDVSASVRIDVGLFTIKISFRFSMRLKETFSIDNLGVPPWQAVPGRGAFRPLGASAGVLGGPADRRLRMRRELAASAGRAVRATRPPNWDNLLPPATPAELTGYAVPGLTLARDEWATAARADQPPCWVMMLLIDSVPAVHEAMLAGPADGTGGDTSFETLCKAVLRWVVAAVQDGPRTSGQIDDLVIDELDLAYLLDDVLVSTRTVPAPVPAEAVERFLAGSFRLTVGTGGSTGEQGDGKGDEKGENAAGEAPDATYLPVPPALVLDIPAYGEGNPASRYAFGSYNEIDGQALARLRDYFAELAVRVSDETASVPGPVPDTSLSMAGWVFGDYFLLLARQMVQAVRDGLRLFKYPIGPDETPRRVVRWINENRAVPDPDGDGPDLPAYTVVGLFAANESHPLRPGRTLTVGVTCRTGEDDTFASLARRYEDAVTASDIAGANAADPGVLRAGARITVPGRPSHTVREGDTLAGIARSLGVRYTELVTDARTLDQPGLLRPGATPLIPLVTCPAGAGATFAALAGREVYAGGFTPAALAECNAGRAVLRPGAEVPFPNQAPYRVRPGDVLGDVAANLGVSLDELLAEGGVLAQEDLIAPMASLALPVFGHVTGAGEASGSLGSVAALFGTTAAVLGEQAANGEVAGLFATRTAGGDPAPYLDVPHLTRFRVGELIAEAQRTFAIRQLSALASRYSLHGLRLPTGGITPKARGMWVREEDGQLRLPPRAGLHALTGQQLALPVLSAEPFRVVLDRAAGPRWLRFTDGAGGETDRLEITLAPGSVDAGRVAELRGRYGRGERLDAGLGSLGPGPMSVSTLATYPFTRTVPLRSPVPVPLPYGRDTAATRELRLHRLPADLTALPDRSVRACDPRMRVRVGRYDEATGATGTADAGAHGWATAVDLTVKRVPPVDGSPTTRSTYEIAGVNDKDAVLLERLLERWAADGDAAAIDRLILAFPGSDDAAGLCNDTLPKVTMGIAQVDLSTRTRPPGVPAVPRAAMADTGPRLLNTPEEFIRLLWEASITRGGGFFLYYDAAAEGRGLPDRLFAGGDQATVTLIVLYAAPAEPAERDRVGAFMNRLATTADLPADATVFAEADPPDPPVRVPAAPDVRLGELARAYYGDVADLLAANTALVLAADARIVVDEGVCQAPPGGIALADLAVRFGTTVEALREANPRRHGRLPDPLPFPAALRLPRLVLTPGTSPSSRTFGEIIAAYGQGAASLAAANQDVPGPFAAGQQITLPGGPRVRTATVRPGIAAVAATRVRPHEVPVEPDADFARLFLLNTFTLLGYQVAGNAAFTESVTGLPAGPTTETAGTENHDKIRAPREAEPGEGVWDYGRAVPYARFTRPDLDQRDGVRSPYEGIGEILQVAFDWRDMYGNTLSTVLSDPEKGDRGPYDQPPLLTGYTDALVGLGQWPSVSSSWQVRAADTGVPRLELLLGFDDSRYQGLLAAAAPDPTTVELTFTAPLAPEGVTDLDHYTFDETVTVRSAVLGADGRTVRLTVSALAADRTYDLSVRGLRYADGPGTIEGRAGFAYPADDQARTSSVAAKARTDAAVYARLRDQLDDPNGIAYTIETTLLGRSPDDPAAPGEAELTPEQARALRTWLCDANGSILAFLDDRAAFGTAVPAPPPAHAIGIELAGDAVNPAQIFPLRVAFRLARTGGTVLGELATAPGVRAATTPVAPFQHPLPPEAGTPGETLALLEFARRLETALSDGEQLVKVAVGVDRSARGAGEETTVWAVRAGRAAGTPISYTLTEDGPAIFAPRPVSTYLRSRRGVPIRDYRTGTGLGPRPSRYEDFAEVDLDGWCRTLFGAVDTLLAPRFTAAAQIVGALTGEDLLARALRVKERLAEAASRWMIPVFEGEHADPAHARELFRQQMLTRLLDAYTVRAAVQFTADVHADLRDPAPPELSGEPVQRGSEEDATPVSLTSPRLPLRTGTGVPLGFLVTAPDTVRADGAVAARADLDIRYEADAIEHQIGPVPGIDYRASSWLTFIDRESPLSADLGAFSVPLVLRAYPASPTMSGQEARYPADHDDPLGRAVRWEYRFGYSLPFHYPQDRVVAEVAFNVGGDRADLDLDDAFGPLAEFAAVHPAVARDLDAYLAPIDALTGPGEEVTNAAAALRTLLTLAEAVADTGLIVEAIRPSVTGGTSYEFSIDEGSVDVGDTPNALLVTITGAPPAGVGVPVVRIDDERYEPVPYTTGEDGPVMYVYRTRGGPEGRYLTAANGQAIPDRTVVIPGLHLLEQQDALASVTVERNRELVPGRPSADSFVYRTPAIRGAAPLQPSTDVSTVLEIPLIGVPTPSQPAYRTLTGHLEAVFSALLVNTTEPALTAQVEVTYAYEANPGLTPVTLPLLMQAPLTTQRPDGDLSRMLAGWAQAIHDWFQARTPICDGTLGFDLTLMTNLTTRPMPLLRLRNLHLPIKYVIDPKPTCYQAMDNPA
ncbi:LysM domain-containing protein [Spirillospora sp. NPDC029432]|uniref:LysM domain-containing protein n=1 Tax=Spirillospora sp. NPDC029432 TaxID=3154599 RepID=UPI0034527CF5